MKNLYTTDGPLKQFTYPIALFLLICIQPALALSFYCQQLDLQQRYDRADSILVAKVLACSTATREYSRITQTCDLHVTEVIKGEARNIISAGSLSGHNQPLAVDESYLLFLDGNDHSGLCSGRGIVDPTARKVSTREIFEAARSSNSIEIYQRRLAHHVLKQLEKMRDYRDGKRTHLKEYWVFEDSGYSCGLKHVNTKSSEPKIELSVIYSDKVPDWAQGSGSPVKQIIPQTGEQWKPAPGTLTMLINMPTPSRIQNKPGELTIDGTSYLFKPWLGKIETVSLLISIYNIHGQPAEEILASLERQPQVRFRAYTEDVNNKGSNPAPDLNVMAKPSTASIATIRGLNDKGSSGTVLRRPAIVDDLNNKGSILPDAPDVDAAITPPAPAVANNGHDYLIDTFGIDEALSEFLACRKTRPMASH